MTKQKWHLLFAKTHKWIGLILGIQLIFWTVGGLVMTWIPLDTVRGEHKISEKPPTSFSSEQNFMPLPELLENAGGQASHIRYGTVLSRPVVRCQFGR
jgi:hypothetical protein